MTLASFLVLLPSVLCGGLLIHLLWPDRRLSALLLKASLGAGLGLAISSYLYFGALLAARGRIPMLAVTLVLLLILAAATAVREWRSKWEMPRLHGLSRLEWAFVAANIIALIFLLLTFVNLSVSRPEGAFDAWSIWNRAARFIYRDPENWRATLSPDLYWGDHPDYPLLVPLNVAWGWRTLGAETQRMPMMQGAIFVLSVIGVMFASLSLVRTVAQASLATLVLMGTPVFVLTGSGLIADVPVMYFIFAASVLLFISIKESNHVLLALSGLMTGMAGWAKNEGLLFMAVGPAAVYLALRKSPWRALLTYLAGLALPLIIIVYFKSIAPAGDLLAGGSGSLSKITDPSRYWIILKALGGQILSFGGWPFSILIGLGFYLLVMYAAPPAEARQATAAVAAILVLQLLGYCAVYLLTPHDLAWHLGTSLERLVLHLFPTGLFLLFCLTRTPEQVFRESPGLGEAR
ncbi:MAG: hypothetical protein ACM3QS_11490 [Bacteroidota bacterium]